MRATDGSPECWLNIFRGTLSKHNVKHQHQQMITSTADASDQQAVNYFKVEQQVAARCIEKK